jgi:uncharacterized protein (TIRG00374 family)
MVSKMALQYHKTHLRDFGAFQTDLSCVNTLELPAIALKNSAEMSSLTPYPASILRLQWQQQRNERLIVKPVLALPTIHRHSKKNWFGIAIRAGVTILLLAFLFHSVSWADLTTTLVHSRHALLLIGLTIGAFGLVVSSYQWHVLMRGEHISLDLAMLINLYMVGVAFSHFLPTGMGGDAIKAIYAGRESGNKQGAASAVLMSRLTGLIGMMIVALTVLILWHQMFPPRLVEGFALLSLLVTSMIVGSIGFVVLLPKFSRLRWTHFHIFAVLVKVGQALLATMKKPRFLSIATIYGMLFWIVGCLNYYAYAIALGIHLPLSFFFVAISVISLISFLPVSINGFGIREGAFVYIFATVHVATSISVLLALLMDTQVLFFGIAGGLIYLTMNRKQQVEQPKTAELLVNKS